MIPELRRSARRSVPVGLALLLASCSAPPPLPEAPTASAPLAPERPTRKSPFVVALVIDQLAMWMVAERWPSLPETGGIHRLLREANAIRELHHGHAQCSTAPGHAALFSGAAARESGVLANARLEPDGTAVSSLFDRSTKLVTAEGARERASSSAAVIRVETVADALRRAHPEAVVLALSMKDRGAIFGGGQRPNASLWFDAETDALVTSSAFPAIPAWAEPYTKPHSAARYRGEPWVPLDPKWLAAHVDLPAADIGQGDFNGLLPKFPHDLAHAKKPEKAFVATPQADAMLVDATIAALGDAAREDAPTLVAVSLSATDYIGHVFGPDAPEAWDQMLRLDAELGRLLDALDRTLGPGGYAIVLSADHGVGSTPEVTNHAPCARPASDRYQRPCEKAVRLRATDLAAAAEKAVDDALGAGDWVLGVSEPFVVLRPATRARPKADLDKAVAAIQGALAKMPGVARTIDIRSEPADCPPPSDESLDALLCRSVRPSQAEPFGDIFIVAQPGSFIDTGYVEGDGVNHGTPYLFDRAVPLVARAPREAPAPAAALPRLDAVPVVDQRAYAATVAGLLGISPPSAAKGGADLSREKRAP